MGRMLNEDDAVSRQAVYTVIEEVLYETTKGADNWYGLLNDGVRTLPSAQSESNCFGCKHLGMWEDEVEYGYPSPCTRCKRRAKDNYER